jgi:hypothetical protein
MIEQLYDVINKDHEQERELHDLIKKDSKDFKLKRAEIKRLRDERVEQARYEAERERNERLRNNTREHIRPVPSTTSFDPYYDEIELLDKNNLPDEPPEDFPESLKEEYRT